MQDATPETVVNDLTQALPSRERERFIKLCETVDLEFGEILSEPGVISSHVYFPLTSFISLVTSIGNHRPLEMGMIGSEGMLGATLLLGVRTAPLRAVVQGSGTALRITGSQFQQELARSLRLSRLIKLYLYVLLAQLSQTAACIHFHEIEARLARWLLMTHDRAHADFFNLTHQFLANMLGVRRSGVTTAAASFQRQGLINYSRGKITIVDRLGLERVACECYAAVVDDYSRLLG